MIYCLMSLLWVVRSISSFTSTQAFSPSKSVYSTRGIILILHSQNNNPRDGSDQSDDADGNNNDDSLLNELRDTKKDLFGADIPTNDELKDAAQNAENAFLAAMLEQTKKFQQIKSEEGSEKACEVFMGKIQEEDEKARGETKMSDREDLANVSDTSEEGGEEDSIEKKWFVQQMQDGNDMKGLEGIDNENDNAWQ